MIVSGSLIIAGLLLTGWLYWLTGRVQQMLDHAEGAVDLADRTLSALPTPRRHDVGLLRWLRDAPAGGPVPSLSAGARPADVRPATSRPAGRRPAVGAPTARAVPGPRPSPLPRTDTAELSAALDAGVRRITEQRPGRAGGRHAAPRSGQAPVH